MYDLYYYPGNASFTPHVLLTELGVPFKLTLVDRDQDGHKSAAYTRLNPAGRIPTLVDGDMVLFETAAICLHLADSHPKAHLAPALGTKDRAQFYQWQMFLTNTIQPEILMYYYSDRYTTDPNGAATVKQAATRRLQDWFAIVEAGLGDGPYFMGAQYTVLDVFYLMLVRWGRYLPTPPVDLPKTGALVRRVLDRPAVQKVIAAEGITGDFVRA